MDYQQSETQKRDYTQVFVWIGFALFFSAFFYALNLWLLDKGFATDMLIYFGEKVQMAYASSNIDDIFFIAPFLPYSLVLAIQDPFLATSILGGVSLSVWLYVITRLYRANQISLTIAIIFSTYLLIAPSFVYIFTQRIYTCLFMSIFILAAYSLRKYYFERLTVQLFVFGISLGVMVQNTIENFGVALIFLPALIQITLLQKRPLLPILIVALFPSIVFIFSPMLLNSLFYGNFNLSVITDANQILEEPAKWYFSWIKIALIVPYLLFFLRIPQFSTKSVFILLLVTPILLILTQILTHSYLASIMELMIFLLFAILLCAKSFGIKFESSKWITAVFSFTLIASLMLNFWLTYNSTFYPEKEFIRTLLGEVKPTRLNTAKEMASYLNNTKGRVASDDRANYKAIFFTHEGKRFIVPTNPFFKTVLSGPSEIVEHVLVNKSKEDEFYQAYGNQIPGFYLAHEAGEYLLFSRR